MKVLFLVALAIAAVVAEPEAEATAAASPDAAADAWYGYYGRGYGYGGYGYGGYGGYYGRGYGGYYRGKRSPDAEPEAEASAVAEPEADADAEAAADAWYGYYGHGYGHGYGYGYGLGHRGYYGYGGYGLGHRGYSGYYGYGYPRSYSYAHHYLGKRSADAEADPLILAGGTKVLTAPTPFIHNPPLVHHAVAPLVAHAPLVGAYAGAYGLHGAYSGYGLPGHYLGKRSADADPLVLAGSTQVLTAPTPFIHNPPLVHHAVAPLVAHAPLAGAYGYGLPFGHYIGKREAEADAQYPLAYAGLPLPYTGAFASAGAVPHVPVVKSVEVTPAEVSSEVHAHAVPVAVGYHGLGHFGHFGYHG